MSMINENVEDERIMLLVASLTTAQHFDPQRRRRGQNSDESR